MNEFLRQAVAALLGGFMASGTATLTILQKVELSDVTDGQWVTIALGGAMAAFSGWRTLLTPPTK